MKKRMLRALLAPLFVAVGALSALGQTPVYNAYEVGKLRAFLEQPSAVAGKTNGLQLNPNYNPNNPNSYGVAWSNDATNKRVTSVYWSFYSLSGTLDFSGFMAITRIDIINNSLSSVNLSGCTSLQVVEANTNKLTNLNLAGCSAITSLSFGENELASIDLSTLVNLTSIYGVQNKLTAISLPANTKLKYLSLGNNQLTSLDVTPFTNLTQLDVSDNKLSRLDLSKNTLLTSLSCEENSLKLSDLPISSTITNFTYAPQGSMKIGTDVNMGSSTIQTFGVNETIDLSSQLTFNGKTTTYVWKKASDGTVVTPTTASGGKFTFSSNFGDEPIYCEMSNDQFPDFKGYTYNGCKKVFRTCNVHIGSTFSKYDAVEVAKLRAYFDATSIPGWKCNGLALNSSYIPDDPTTYPGITWRSNGTVKRAISISLSRSIWSGPNLIKPVVFDISGFEWLMSVSIDIPQQSVTVKDCPLLENLNIDSWTASLGVVTCKNLPALATARISSDGSTLTAVNLDFTQSPKLKKITLEGVDLAGAIFDKTKIVDLRLRANLTSFPYADYPNVKALNLHANYISDFDPTRLPSLSTCNLAYNCFKLSDLYAIRSRIPNLEYDPQRELRIGKDNAIGGVILKSIAADEELDLSSEYKLGTSETSFVWKKSSDNSIITPKTINAGKFTFGSDLEQQAIYCEMINPQLPDITSTSPFKTCKIYIGKNISEYNPDEVAKLKAFLDLSSSIDGKINGQKVSSTYNSNDPKTFGVSWSSDVINKKVTSINWRNYRMMGFLDVSNFSKLTSLDVLGNALTGINVDNTPLLTSLDIRYNNLTYSTLISKPAGVNSSAFYRTPQEYMGVGEVQVVNGTNTYVLAADQVVDLSKEYKVGGYTTTFTWYDGNTNAVVSPTSSSSGKFTFNSSFVGKSIYCTMSNAGFPDFSEYRILRTVNVKVSASYNQNDVDKLKAFLNKPSQESGKTNGQQLNAAYNPEDPATYGVAWSRHNVNKRVINFQWIDKKLSGDLDLSGCELLRDVYMMGNKISSANFKGCSSLVNLYAVSNEMAVISLNKHPLLESVDISRNKIAALATPEAPVLNNLFAAENKLSVIDLSKLSSLSRVKLMGNELTSIDVSGLAKLQMLKVEDNKIAEVKFDGNKQLALVNLENNQLSSVDISSLSSLSDLTLSNNKMVISKLPLKSAEFTFYSYAPQQAMVIGRPNQSGSVLKYTIYAEEQIDLSSELNVGGNSTTYTWKRADGTVVKPQTNNKGGFSFPCDMIGQIVFCEMTNASFPDFTDGNIFKTVSVTVESPYNGEEVASLLKFFKKGDVNSHSNADILGISKENNPGSWTGIDWSKGVSDRRVIAIRWAGYGLKDTLSLSGFRMLQSLDVSNNLLSKVEFANVPVLKRGYFAGNKLKYSTMIEVDAFDDYSFYPQGKIEIGTKNANGTFSIFSGVCV